MADYFKMVFKKIDHESANSITSALSIFTLPPTNVSISSSLVREYLPLNPLTDVPYHFKIHPSTSFIDLNKCYLLSEMCIKKVDANGNLVNIDDNELVAPINLIGSTWIKNLKISVQGREVYDSNSLYAYKSYFDTELSFSRDVKDSHLQASGYFTDGEDQDSLAVTQKGFTSRKELFANSKPVQLITKIDADIFNQERYMVNGVEIDLQFTPNDTYFMLMASAGATQYKLEITSLKLYVKTLELVDGLALDIQKRLENKEAKYVNRKSYIKSTFLSPNRTEYNGVLFTGQIPKRVILGMVENSAYVGHRTKSPFNFKPFDVRSISIMANGKQWPAAPFELDFTNNQYTRAFYELNEALGISGSTDSNGISLKKYRNGWTIFAFNMTNSMEDNECVDLITEGTTTVSISFRTPIIQQGIVLIAYCEMDSILILDKNRTVMSDVTVG